MCFILHDNEMLLGEFFFCQECLYVYMTQKKSYLTKDSSYIMYKKVVY